MAELDSGNEDGRFEAMLLQGKNAVVTGCARGIGKAMLGAFAENGANVWACCRTCCRTKSDEFEAFARQLSVSHGVRVDPLYFDLTDASAMKNAVKAIVAEKVAIDVLVNNAGITYNALFPMTSLEKMHEVFDVNFFAQVSFSQYIARLMTRQRSGSIINVSSTAALDGNPGRGAYGASKAAVVCMTRVMAHELAEYNIRVNAIAPGITNTDMVEASMSEAVIDAAVQSTRLKRIGEPSEIADVALFLASDLASYVTGEVLRVDGGLQN
jgi:3-oxoacyl-[acyl-carrier protein] reductase